MMFAFSRVTYALPHFSATWLGCELPPTKALFCLIAVGTSFYAEAKSGDILHCLISPKKVWKMLFLSMEFFV